MLYKFDGRQPKVGADSYISDLARVIGDVVNIKGGLRQD